jgi:phosphohistidine phosphatase
MQLLFLRHGPAVAKTDWTAEEDARPLSAEGRLLVRDIACSLPRLKTHPDVIITSPLARAHQTAEIVGNCLDEKDNIVVDKRLAPGFGLKQLEKVLRDYPEDTVLMLVGHDPDFSELVRTLTGGRISIRKGGLAQVEIPDVKEMKGRLVCLLVPAPLDPDASAGDMEP